MPQTLATIAPKLQENIIHSGYTDFLEFFYMYFKARYSPVDTPAIMDKQFTNETLVFILKKKVLCYRVFIHMAKGMGYL